MTLLLLYSLCKYIAHFANVFFLSLFFLSFRVFCQVSLSKIQIFTFLRFFFSKKLSTF